MDSWKDRVNLGLMNVRNVPMLAPLSLFTGSITDHLVSSILTGENQLCFPFPVVRSQQGFKLCKVGS